MNRMPLIVLLLGLGAGARAGQVEIVDAVLVRDAASWNASVTLRHADTGWKHYADAWRVVDAEGRELGKRVLYHPHVKEQPFTRSLHGIAIPPGTRFVWIEAHDNVHGWARTRLRLRLDWVMGRSTVAGRETRSAPRKGKARRKDAKAKERRDGQARSLH